MSTGDQILKLDDENHKIKKNNWGINWDNKQIFAVQRYMFFFCFNMNTLYTCLRFIISN